MCNKGEKNGYSLITQSNKFNEKIKVKLGIKSTFKNSKIKAKSQNIL